MESNTSVVEAFVLNYELEKTELSFGLMIFNENRPPSGFRIVMFILSLMLVGLI